LAHYSGGGAQTFGSGKPANYGAGHKIERFAERATAKRAGQTAARANPNPASTDHATFAHV